MPGFRISGPDRMKTKIGLVLGGGAARGWAHIGVIRTLVNEGIVPDIVTGCSIGAVVGGCFVAGKLDQLEEFARSLSKARVLRFLDFHFNGSGLISGKRLQRILENNLKDIAIENLPMRFGAVATELGSGHEIWLTKGSLIEAMRASYALPGVFDPVRHNDRWLFDGALVNPVPITMARAFGADIVICVNLSSDVGPRGTVIQSSVEQNGDETPIEQEIEQRRSWSFPFIRPAERKVNAPGLASVMVDAFNIVQDRISRSRLAGDPPDILISPRLRTMNMFEFHRADEAIVSGALAVKRAMSDIRELMAIESQPLV